MPSHSVVFYSSPSGKLLSAEPKVENLEDHCYAASPTLADHQYASHGPLWLKDCDALQDELVGEIPLVESGIPAWFNDPDQVRSLKCFHPAHYFVFR